MANEQAQGVEVDWDAMEQQFYAAPALGAFALEKAEQAEQMRVAQLNQGFEQGWGC